MRFENELLYVHRTIAERAERFARSALKGRRQFGLGVHTAHAFTAASGSRFQKNRKPDLARKLERLFCVANGTWTSRNPGNTHRAHGVASRDLVAHQAHALGRRTHECQTCFFAGFDKVRAFAQKSVAWVNELRSARFGSRDYFFNVQVAVFRSRAAQVIGLVAVANMLGKSIRVGIDRNRWKPECTSAASHANRDLATVSNEEWSSLHHSGMFPCLRVGVRSRFPSRAFKPLMSKRRVSSGAMTSSM